MQIKFGKKRFDKRKSFCLLSERFQELLVTIAKTLCNSLDNFKMRKILYWQ